jgi:hypothetical protein
MFSMMIAGIIFFTFLELWVVSHKPAVRKFMEEKPVASVFISLAGSAIITSPTGGAGTTITFASGISTMICILFYRSSHAVKTHTAGVGKVKDGFQEFSKYWVKPVARGTATGAKTATKPVVHLHSWLRDLEAKKQEKLRKVG